MDITFSGEINVLDLIALLGWAIGIIAGAGWLRRRYANRIESDPMRVFEAHISDLETIAEYMERRGSGYFTQQEDGSEDTQASGRIADVMADYAISEMVYRQWLISCRNPSRKNERAYLHIRPLPGLYIVDPR